MRSFKYQSLPNSYQCPSPIDDISADDLPLNHDLTPLASLEYKGISEILILKGEYRKYKKTIWSSLVCCCCCPCPKKKLIQIKTGYLVRIPVAIQSSSNYITRNRDYVLSYKTWMLLKKPNLIGKQSGFLYLGFELSLEDYCDDDIIIKKAKKSIEEMLEIYF